MLEMLEIRNVATKSEKVSKLLLNISGPLKAGDKHGFYILLKIMKDHGKSYSKLGQVFIYQSIIRAS